jgi:hypothetical protein
MMQDHQGIISSSGSGGGSYIEKNDTKVELQHGDVSVLSPALFQSGKSSPAPFFENDIHRFHLAEGGILLLVEKLNYSEKRKSN